MMARSFLCIAVVLGAASVASADVVGYNVILQYLSSYDAGFTDLGKLPNSSAVLGDGTTKTTISVGGAAAYHQFEVLLKVNGMAADQDAVYFQYGGVTGGGASFPFADGSYAESGLAGTAIDPPAMGSPSSNAPSHAPFNLNFFNAATKTFVHDVWTGTSTGLPLGNTYGDYAAMMQLGEGAAYDIGSLYLAATTDGTFGLSFASNPGNFKILTGNTAGAAASSAAGLYPTYVGLGDSIEFTTGAPPVTPEPGTLALLATGLMGLLAYAWRKRR